ncbi:hypothetical protein AAG906_013009 [Vitis piasezkii]
MFKNFHNMRKLHIINCGMEDVEDVNTPTNDKLPQLVLSSSMFKNFHNLKELRIIDCGMEDMRGVNTSTNDEVLFNEKVSFLESRASTLNKIMDALRDDNINLIGVWGMAGVGKTTLLKQVAQQPIWMYPGLETRINVKKELRNFNKKLRTRWTCHLWRRMNPEKRMN